ncbi:MAG: PKD domain-containing protein [Blastochloris sp.]|nr:PKD domain-containing protein [Blastochloris sp.]
MHDPENGLTILPEFLPTYGDYLFDGADNPHPYGRLANPLLEDSSVVNGAIEDARNGTMAGKVFDPYLGNPHLVDQSVRKYPVPPGFQTTYRGLNTPAKMALLEQRIGADNICIVYGGDGTEDTTYGHAVATPLTMAPHWLNGLVGNDSYKAMGDNLITADSAAPIDIFDGIEPQYYELEGALQRQISHRTIVGELASISATTQCLTELVPPFLSEQSPQLATTTATTPIQSLLLYAPGPVELLLTDAQGRRLGYDPDSGTILKEIPDALYYQNPDEPAVTLFIYGADLGDYDITVTGTATGDYEVIGWYEDDTATIDLVYEEGSTAAGASSQIDIEVPHDTRDVPTPPQVQAGPNLHVTVGQAVTFAGAFSDLNPDDSHTIAWDFGDRTMSASSLTPEHTYIATGQYTATLTITDSTNFVVEDSLFVDVTGPALAPLSFTEPVTYSSRVGPYGALTLADGNNDTIPDIIGSDGIAGSRQLVSALSGNGDGSFAPPEFIELDSVYGVAVADFDGDQLADMALAHQLSLFILPGRGVGQWPRFDPDALRYTSESFRSVITADFNGDGRPDLATSNIATRDVEIWYGNGDGTFQASVRYAVGALPFSLVSSDLSGDGLPDLMIANAGDNSVSVLINTGDQFTAAVTYPVGDYPMMVTAADFNGDGSPDLATANGRDDTISILFNDSTGQLQSALPVPLKQHPHSITTGDLNSDGARDIIVGTNRTVDTFLGYADGTFHTAHSYAIPGLVSSMDVADLDADGNDDLVVLNMHYGEVNVFLQR